MIGGVFSEIKNKVQSGYHLGVVIDVIDQAVELRLRWQTEKHELSHLTSRCLLPCTAKVSGRGRSGHDRRGRPQASHEGVRRETSSNEPKQSTRHLAFSGRLS